MSRASHPGVFGGSAWVVGRVAGIELSVDRSWIPVFLLVTWMLGLQLGPGAEGAVAARWVVAFAGSLVFFSSLVLHELGHSLVALQLGLRVRSITLFLFGGVAQLESEPAKPGHDIAIALAGPAVSAVLGLLFLAVAGSFDVEASIVGRAFLWLGNVNLVIAVFNLLPGSPLDGGRVLRGAVWKLTGSFERATATAAAGGAVVAYALMGLGAFAALSGGIVGGLWLCFIGWFLLQTSRLSVTQGTLKRILEQIPVGEVMEPVSEACIRAEDSVGSVAEGAILRRGLRTLFVIDRVGRLEGLVTLRDVADTPVDKRATTSVRAIMHPVASVTLAGPRESTWDVLARMGERRVNQLPVVADERLLGTVTRERLIGLVQAELALEG